MKNLLAILILATVTLPASAQTIRKGSDGSVTVFHKDGTSDGLIDTTTPVFTGDKTFSGKLTFSRDLVTGGTATLSNNVSSAGIFRMSIGAAVGNVDGLTNGVAGQLLVMYGSGGASSVTLRHNNAGGTQKFLLPGAANVTITGGYGGALFFCDGTFWIMIGHTN
jgi:hypothetical protein